jgi:hypothetical protein
MMYVSRMMRFPLALIGVAFATTWSACGEDCDIQSGESVRECIDSFGHVSLEEYDEVYQECIYDGMGACGQVLSEAAAVCVAESYVGEFVCRQSDPVPTNMSSAAYLYWGAQLGEAIWQVQVTYATIDGEGVYYLVVLSGTEGELISAEKTPII